MPFSDNACSTAGRSSPGGVAVAATRITCAPAAPSFIAAGASDRSDVITQSGVSRAECTRRLVPGIRKLRSSTIRTGERASMPGRRQVSDGIVREHGADPDQDGVALRAKQMHARLGGLARDRDRLVAGGADLVVGGDGELEDDMRALVANATEMPGMIVRGFRGIEADIDDDARRAEFGVALPGHFRIGILDRRHHAGDAGGDHGIDAGRRFADMRTGLQRHIERGAARGFTGALQCVRLGMRTAAGLGPAAGDNDAVFHHDRTDGGVRPGAPLPAPPERQGKLHEARVSGLGIPGFLRELVFQNAEDHLRNAVTRASSSPDNSPSTASKSLASRKLR